MKKMWRDPLAIFGCSMLVFLLLILLIGPLIVQNNPLEINMSNRFQPPSTDYPLGTDHLGRCTFSRLMEGAKATLQITFLVVLTAIVIGAAIGLFSSYLGGKWDAFFMRIADGFMTIPDFLIAIALTGFLGPSLTNIAIAIVCSKWFTYARITRSIVIAEKEKNYIQSAITAGSSSFAIITRHLVRHVVPTIAVIASLDIGKIILMISALSFLGLGAQPPMPEWGAMLNESRAYFQLHPELMFYPGVMIAITVLSFNLIGDSLRDSLDVKE
ncbi:nickel transporter permease [Niallia sp. 01092]|uniref:nickel transporter permease n=1 Tax=unclassified Niallia TaxID=2837522 RepID=UPI003FD1E32A